MYGQIYNNALTHIHTAYCCFGWVGLRDLGGAGVLGELTHAAGEDAHVEESGRGAHARVWHQGRCK